jgi:hypothetical protein
LLLIKATDEYIDLVMNLLLGGLGVGLAERTRTVMNGGRGSSQDEFVCKNSMPGLSLANSGAYL